MPKNKIKINLERILKDFSQPKSSLRDSFHEDYYKFSVITIKSYEKWRLVRFLFDEILHFQIYDKPVEKVNWEIPFVYKRQHHCFATHQKFGFRIYISNKDSKKPHEVAEEIAKIIEKALDKSEPLVKLYALTSLKEGDISIDNRLYELRQPYAYFKKEVTNRKKRLRRLSELKESNKYRSEIKLQTEISYFEQAGYVAFFSLLEHLCILFLAFRDVPERNDVKSFAEKIWQDKFKIVFDINQKEFKEHYDYLLGLSRYKRNPSVHGLFDKLHSIFHFYLPAAKHRISVGLYNQDLLLRWRDEILNFSKLDAFLKLLQTQSSTKRIMTYLDTGLNVVYGKHKENLDGYSSKGFKEFLELQVSLSDDMGNMDW